MTDIFQIENIKLVVLFVLIASVIAMSHFGGATPRRQLRQIRQARVN